MEMYKTVQVINYSIPTERKIKKITNMDVQHDTFCIANISKYMQKQTPYTIPTYRTVRTNKTSELSGKLLRICGS